VIYQDFVNTVALAMGIFFNCKSYSTRLTRSIDWTFYGIAENTATAAIAFEIAHNKILEWACAHKGISTSFSYCRGVADGLLSMAREERENEREEVRRKELETLAAREREEKLQRQRELKRLNALSDLCGDDTISDSQVGTHPSVSHDERHDDRPSSPESLACLGEPDSITDCSFDNDNFFNFDDSDDCRSNNDEGSPEAKLEPDFRLDSGESLDPTADLEQEIHRILKRERSPTIPLQSIKTQHQQEVKPEVSLRHDVSDIVSSVLWASEMQLVQFRATAEQVAEDFLKAKNIQLHKRKKKGTAVRDFEAYRQGKEDSKKIDVRQKMVE
jgi:hypothetical protein